MKPYTGPNPKKWSDGHEHKWVKPLDGDANEKFWDVKCSECGMPGQEHRDGSVYYPAT